MGKRSTNTTKSGKFMNPTDQARKEARKRELKKNKKQRQMVRTAVLKGKNPRDIILELEKVDDMEFNVLSPPPLNDKVLKDKRRKLGETWTRVMKLYEKEDVEQFIELKKLWHSYQGRKNEIVAAFEAVRSAQNVQLDDIPLPTIAADGDADVSAIPGDIPLPPSSLFLQPRAGILKKKPSSVLLYGPLPLNRLLIVLDISFVFKKNFRCRIFAETLRSRGPVLGCRQDLLPP